MANIYLKKVTSSSRSEWTSGTSYVAGDRVYLTSSTIESVHPANGATFSAIRTFVCLVDNSSTTSPEDDATNWIEAGISKEYPYHSIDGALDSDAIDNEIYLEAEATRYGTQATRGSTYHHLRRDETQYSLGKLIIISDTESNPVFKITKNIAVMGFAIEPDESIERFSIVCLNNGNIGSNSQHNDNDSQYAKIDKCDIYFSGNTGSYMIGGLYHNANKIEFTDCLFSEQASKVGYADCTVARAGFGNRNFVGFKRCSFFFPSIPYKDQFLYDTQGHSTGQRSFIISCSMWFQSFDTQYFLHNHRSGDLFKDNIFYFSTSSGQEIRISYSASNSLDDSANNILYIADNSATFNFTNSQNSGHTSEYYSDRFIIKDPLYVLNSDDPSGLQLRPSSPLIGGLLDNDSQQYQLESQYPQGKWFDSNAAAGGDGSWETPYNNYAEAIDSFTGDEAVVLIKEGQHKLRRGYWSSNTWNYNVDLPKSYPGGIKFIGMGSDTIFTTDSDVTGYGAFFVSSNATRDNLLDTPFTFKNFDILLNNTTTLGRGAICVLKAEYINVNVSQAFNLGATTSNLFDYMMSSDVARGHYLKMSNCTINVSQSNNNSSTNFLVGGDGGMKQFKGCTFVDLNRTTSTNAASPTLFMHHNFGAFQGSYLQDCIIYSKTSNTQHFGTSPSSGLHQGSPSLDIKNVIVYSTNQTVSVGSNFGDNVSTVDPKFIATEPHDFDLRLRPDSPGIGGIKPELSNVYYLQPGNAYNGDGSQKDASSMTADGDPGPFNEFKEIVAAGVPYGSTIVILNGTYDWTESFGRNPSSNVGPNTWHAYTLAGYNYVAETMHEVIFDAKLNLSNVFIYKPYGGTAGSGVFLDLDTTFNGIQFNNMIGSDPNTRNMISSVSGSAGLGSCTFKNCKFLGHINKGGAYQYPWTGGGRDTYSSTMHWDSCEISIAFDYGGGLLCGGDGFANDIYHGAWSWKNCTFHIPTGMTTFNGRNAANGTYVSPLLIFGNNYSQTQRVFENNIIQIENGTARIGANSSDKLPTIENNCLNGVLPVTVHGSNTIDHSAIIESKSNLLGVDPLFVDPSNNNFSLRPLSPIIGKG